MKLSVKAYLITADRRHFLISKYLDKIKTLFKIKNDEKAKSIIDQVIKMSVQATATNTQAGKPIYSEWILNMFLRSNSGLNKRMINGQLEDSSKVVEILKMFNNLKEKQNVPFEKDITTYQTFSELSKVMFSDAVQSVSETLIKQEDKKDVKIKIGKADLPGIETLWHGTLEGNQYWIYKAVGTAVETLDSLIMMGGKPPYVCAGGDDCNEGNDVGECEETGIIKTEGTWYCFDDPEEDERGRFFPCNWCTVTRSMNKYYLADGPMITIFRNEKPYAQIHAKTNQFEDPNGEEMDKHELMGLLENVPNYTSVLSALFSNGKSSILDAIKKIVNKDKTAKKR